MRDQMKALADCASPRHIAPAVGGCFQMVIQTLTVKTIRRITTGSGLDRPPHAALLGIEREDSTISRSNKLFSSAHRHAIRLAPVPIEVF